MRPLLQPCSSKSHPDSVMSNIFILATCVPILSPTDLCWLCLQL
jgi:hypothetical protein